MIRVKCANRILKKNKYETEYVYGTVQTFLFHPEANAVVAITVLDDGAFKSYFLDQIVYENK